ncbi:MAG TPA: hypothetical protein VEB66_16375 [Opitutaceae bacterium]|nr:hypothetical protein [Opitutaceae bacterium]
MRLPVLIAFAALAGDPLAAQTAPNANEVSAGVPATGARPLPRVGDPAVPGLGPTLPAAPRLAPVFFPSPVPALDGALPPAPAVRDAIWNDLLPHANELFFAPLSTRLAEGDLNRRLRQRLDSYVAARDAARATLRQALAAPERGAALALAAPALEPKLAELAAAGDELRRDLYRGGFLSGNYDWSAYRNWRLGGESRRSAQELLYDEYSVLRAAIYYQEGLSPEQRHLLREVAIELGEAIGRREAPADGGFDPERVIFFLPHGSRWRLPADLPAAAHAPLDEFIASKSALKRELREALFRLDAESAARRERELAELAARQAPALAALEQQAERIREIVAGARGADRPAVPPGLPPALVERINRYLREKADLQRAAHEAQEPAGRKGRAAAAAGREALAAFEERHRARLAALAEEARAIRTEVARATGGESGGKTVDGLLAEFAEAFRRQELRALYGDYRTAMLEPGLAPAQRRLLYDAAVAALDLPGVKEWQAVPE